MRPIHLARLDKTRPVLVLTREAAPAEALVSPFDLRVEELPH